MNKRSFVAAALSLLLSACVSASAGSDHRTNVLTQEEIQSVNVSNLYELVQRLRPRWLTVRAQQSFRTPTEVVVFENQTLLGGTEMLRQVSPDMVLSMEYLDGPTASASLPGLGSRQVEGAIVLHTNRSRS